MFDDILKTLNLKYEELNDAERQTYHTWLESMASKQISPKDILDYLNGMVRSIQLELIATDEFVYTWIFKRVNRKHIMLKARLNNYLLLISFLETPAKASEQLKRIVEANAAIGSKK